MFFPMKKCEYGHGDTRVVKRFAIVPFFVVNESTRETIGVVWLEKYDAVQKFYYSVRWCTDYRCLSGCGKQLAIHITKSLYGGRFIDEPEND